MDPITRQAIAVAGGASGDQALYVDDVFSTFLYKGNNSSQTINNGIDLSGEGGLVWQKGRSFSSGSWSIPHMLFDTERGAHKLISSSSSDAESTPVYGVDSFNSNGFSLNDSYTHSNSSVIDGGYCSWTFRKAPGFFDVVTWTGNGSVRTIAHSLGSVPGFIMVKRTSSSRSWVCYHRSLGATKYLQLNSTDSAYTHSSAWNNTEPTSSVITIGEGSGVNAANETYVAYVFAHDDQSFGKDSDQAIIKCGQFSGTGSIDFGFEPQWVLIKPHSQTYNWEVYDTMRGLPAVSGGSGPYARALYSNLSNAEANGSSFTLESTGLENQTFGSSYPCIYVAIRRSHKPPSAGTDIFTAALTGTPGSGGATQWRPENVDMAWFAKRGGDSKNFHVADRVRSFQGTNANSDDSYTTPTLQTNSTAAELTSGTAIHQSHYSNAVVDVRAVSSGSNFLFYRFKRAPGFFDIVHYRGTGTTNNVTHNLQAVPELMIFKNLDQGVGWPVWFGDGSNICRLDITNGKFDEGLNLNATSATNIPISSGNSSYNNNNVDYIVYLFATLSGISKIGTFSGTGYDVNVDCGFTAGARFVLIKRLDSSGDWYLWDTERGIVSGNDPYLLVDSTAAEVTNTDYIDPLNAGFTVTSSAPAALNASGGTYLFLAIA